MAEPLSPSSHSELPAEALWTTPMAWCSSPLRPIQNYSREFPSNATFVRAEAVYTFNEELEPGMMRQTQAAFPALLRLDKGAPVAVHVAGPDNQCWTYRAERKGRKTTWAFYAGDAFPAADPAPDSLIKRYAFDQIVVQSILPAEGSRRHISFIIRDDFSMQDLSKSVDPDPND